MKLYSDFAAQRARQMTADVVALALIAISIATGIVVFSTVNQLARVRCADAERGHRLPHVDDRRRHATGWGPVHRRGDQRSVQHGELGGDTLAAAGQTQQDLVLQAAIALGVGVAALPILIVLLVWLIPRLRFISRATRTRALMRSGLNTDLLALRALTHQKAGVIAKIAPDAVGAWRRSEPEVMQRLAGLELRSVGIRP